MTMDREKAKELLGSGLSNEIVASALGVTSGYIGQLWAEEEFASAVIELRTKNLTAHSDRDKKIDSIEDKLIEQLDEAVSNRQIYKPRDILATFAVVNAARRRGVPAQLSAGLQQPTINLQLPSVVIQHFTTTPQGEVVDVTVNEQKHTLITMPSGQLLKTLAAQDSGNGDKYERVRKFLPSPETAESGGQSGYLCAEKVAR